MILGGRFPLLVILVLGLVVAATKGVPWVLKQLRDPIPEFRVDDVRDARYVAPYDVEWPRSTSGDVEHVVTVYGESVTARYWEAEPFRGSRDFSIKPDAVIEAKAGEMVTLPDGQTIAISAFVLQPTVRPLGAPRDVPFEDVYFSATGEKVTAEEALILHNRYGRHLEMYSWENWSNGPAFNLDIEIETDLETDAIAEHSVRDTITGGLALLHSSGFKRQTGNVMKLVVGKYHRAAVRPTAMALHLLIRQGEKEVVEFEPVAPQTVTLETGEFHVDAVWTSQPPEMRTTVLSGEMKQSTTFSGGGTNTGIELSGLPGTVAWIKARLRNGDRTGYSAGGGSSFSFLSEPDDVEAIEVTVYPRLVHVVFLLPDLPGVPEENRGKSRVNEMVCPPTVIRMTVKPTISFQRFSKPRCLGIPAPPRHCQRHPWI